MKLIQAEELKKIFNLLNEKNFNYILINKSDEKEFINFFHSNDYQTIDHPFKYDVFLYGVDSKFQNIDLNNKMINFIDNIEYNKNIDMVYYEHIHPKINIFNKIKNKLKRMIKI